MDAKKCREQLRSVAAVAFVVTVLYCVIGSVFQLFETRTLMSADDIIKVARFAALVSLPFALNIIISWHPRTPQQYACIGAVTFLLWLVVEAAVSSMRQEPLPFAFACGIAACATGGTLAYQRLVRRRSAAMKKRP